MIVHVHTTVPDPEPQCVSQMDCGDFALCVNGNCEGCPDGTKLNDGACGRE